MTLYYKINYYYNKFFILNNEYYIYINVTNNNHIYNFELKEDNILYFNINNKNNKTYENYNFKIIHKNKETNIVIINNPYNNIKIGNIKKLNYDKDFNLINIVDSVIALNKFDIQYYINNNNFINNNYKDNIEYVYYHWLLCGKTHPYLYFKYLLKKHENLIFKLKTPNIKYNENNNNTLLFIDDRYDLSFIYLLKLFCYSVDETWNITIVTLLENEDLYKKDFDKLNIEYKFILLNKKFNSSKDYSELLKSNIFWKNINEENCLIFQYDSFCMNKFDNIFFNYNYIGARWPHKASIYSKITLGNGGTSFRKTRIMEKICEKYINNDNFSKRRHAEDVFLCELLFENNLHNCTNEIADKFSFENIFNDNSIYAHQIYNTIKLDDLNNFVYNKLIKMINV
jgi:hypothetical protein